jgi:hypothetical protein
VKHALRFAVGPVQVRVTANAASVLDYLREFYTPVDDIGPWHGWTVQAEVGPASPDAACNRWGVSYGADAGGLLVRLQAEDPGSLAITARKCVREVLVDFCEHQRYIMLHASAVISDNRTLVFVGDKGSGKTTLAMKAVIRHRMRYLSNDHLIVCRRGDGDLTLTSLPTFIPLKIGTFLDLERHLPEPWDSEGLDVEAYRGLPRAQTYASDRRVLYTYRRLGQDNPIAVDVGRKDRQTSLLIVLANYSPGSVRCPQPVSDPVRDLLAHLRTDWMFNPDLNQHHLPRAERSPAEYAADARQLITALAGQATVVRWAHRGDPAPILGSAADRRPA